MQLFYSILGLDPNKGLDIVMDERQQIFSVQTDNDCKKNNFEESLLPVQLFFKMFDSLTNYRGMEEGLHKYQMIQLDKDNKVTPQFFFYFDTDLKLVKTRLSHHEVGHYDFSAVRPIQEKVFVEEDFYQIECDQLSEVVI